MVTGLLESHFISRDISASRDLALHEKSWYCVGLVLVSSNVELAGLSLKRTDNTHPKSFKFPKVNEGKKIMTRAVRVYYHFGAFRLDVAARALSRDKEIIPLTPKLFETLLLLLQHHGKLVEREQLIKTVWQDDFVEEGNISSTIYLLRKALGHNGKGQPYIVTVPRLGYRFTAPVQELCIPEQAIALPTLGIIVVLPFRSLNTNERDDGLSLGLADALITRLSNCRKLTVRPTNAVRKYLAADVELVTVGQELGAELIVECNFQRRDSYIRVTAQLISVTDGVPLWAAKYDEEFTDLFALEDVMSKNIANDLILELLEKLSPPIAQDQDQQTLVLPSLFPS